jgi:hypothetical protein
MPFDWRENLTLAEWLQANTPPGMSRECACRCAIGRAYYAAFGHALTYARDYLGFTPNYDADDHGALRRHLKEKKRQKTSECLERLREWRNACDYSDQFQGDLEATLINALEEARYVFDSLPPPRPRTPPQPTPTP